MSTITQADLIARIAQLEGELESRNASSAVLERETELLMRIAELESARENLEGRLAATTSPTYATERERELAARLMAREREDVIAAGVAAKKLTPAQVKALADMPLDFVQRFVELTHPHSAFTNDHHEPRYTRGNYEWRGKTWAQLTPREMHELYTTEPELFDLMKGH